MKTNTLLSACKASSLTTSLTSVNENIYRVFQQPFVGMNDPRASKSAHKQVISTLNRLGATD